MRHLLCLRWYLIIFKILILIRLIYIDLGKLGGSSEGVPLGLLVLRTRWLGGAYLFILDFCV
jgi:hypothetical protein